MSSNSEFDVDVRKDVMWMEPESNGATSRGVKVVIWTGGVVDILLIVELWKIHSCKDGLPLDLNAPELFIPSILKPRIQKRYRLFRIMGSFFLA
jgi:hypothetical protein